MTLTDRVPKLDGRGPCATSGRVSLGASCKTDLCDCGLPDDHHGIFMKECDIGDDCPPPPLEHGLRKRAGIPEPGTSDEWNRSVVATLPIRPPGL